MSEEWRVNPSNENTEPVNDAAPNETTAPADPAGVPETGAAEPAGATEAAGAADVTGAQPPFNGWSSDGSYRFVPPRNGAGKDSYTSPAGNGGYTPPAGNSYTPPTGGSYTPPTGGYYTPQYSTPSYGNGGGQPPRKKHNGWIVAIAVVAAVCLIASVVFLALGFVNKRRSVYQRGGQPQSGLYGGHYRL